MEDGEPFLDGRRSWEESIYWTNFRSIHFFQLLHGDFQKQLGVPKKFAYNMKNELGEHAILKGPSGSSWKVGLVAQEEGLFFKNGWEEFAKDHLLAENDVLIFKYDGQSRFELLVFDRESLCEKEAAYFCKMLVHMEKEMKEDGKTFLDCRSWGESLYWTHFRSIRFFRILHGDFQKQLGVPKKFAYNMKNELGEHAILKGPSGSSWKVGLVVEEVGLFFKNGWEEFAKDHLLAENDVLMFKYEGHSRFEVLVFDRESLCEKEAAYFFKRLGHMEKEREKEKEMESEVGMKRKARDGSEVVTDTPLPRDTERPFAPALAEEETHPATTLLEEIANGSSPIVTDQEETHAPIKGPPGSASTSKEGTAVRRRSARKEPGSRSVVCSTKRCTVKSPEQVLTVERAQAATKNVDGPRKRKRGRKSAVELKALLDGGLGDGEEKRKRLGHMEKEKEKEKEKDKDREVESEVESEVGMKRKARDGSEIAEDEPSMEETHPATTLLEEIANGSSPIVTDQEETHAPIKGPPGSASTSKEGTAVRKTVCKDPRFRSGVCSTRMSTVKSPEQVLTVERAEAAMKSESFMVVMQPTHVLRRFYLSIPVEWSDKHLRCCNQSLILRTKGKTWHVRYNYSARKYGGISSGWRKFALDNYLQESDVCLFNLGESMEGKPVLDVSIFRISESLVYAVLKSSVSASGKRL